VTSLDTRFNALGFPLCPHEAETTYLRGGGHCGALIFLLASRRACGVLLGPCGQVEKSAIRSL
jgi:hypothetical protein